MVTGRGILTKPTRFNADPHLGSAAIILQLSEALRLQELCDAAPLRQQQPRHADGPCRPLAPAVVQVGCPGHVAPPPGLDTDGSHLGMRRTGRNQLEATSQCYTVKGFGTYHLVL